METTWVYVRSEPGLWTVGFYDPKGQWHADSDHDTTDKAAARVHYLNGGTAPAPHQIRPHHPADAGAEETALRAETEAVS